MVKVHLYRDEYPKYEYEPGDLVRLLSGSAPQRVLRVVEKNGQQYLYCQYLSGLHHLDQFGRPYHNKARIASDFVLLRDVRTGACIVEINQIKEKEPMTKLYQTKTENPEYGTFLATNSAGRVVLEMKGSGSVRDFAPDEVEVVVPYTVRLKGVAGPLDFHAQVSKGSVEKHDLIYSGGAFFVVVALDTKAEGAKSVGSFRRFKGTLVEGDTEEYTED